jgi:hypothetical protein
MPSVQCTDTTSTRRRMTNDHKPTLSEPGSVLVLSTKNSFDQLSSLFSSVPYPMISCGSWCVVVSASTLRLFLYSLWGNSSPWRLILPPTYLHVGLYLKSFLSPSKIVSETFQMTDLIIRDARSYPKNVFRIGHFREG